MRPYHRFRSQPSALGDDANVVSGVVKLENGRELMPPNPADAWPPSKEGGRIQA